LQGKKEQKGKKKGKLTLTVWTIQGLPRGEGSGVECRGQGRKKKEERKGKPTWPKEKDRRGDERSSLNGGKNPSISGEAKGDGI